MAVSKKKKRAKQNGLPISSKTPYSVQPNVGKEPVNCLKPERYYDAKPSWNFKSSDKEQWAFTQDCVGDMFWREILPRLEGFEQQKWQDILLNDKKHNHSIDVESLNKVAQDRLSACCVEAESLVSLRLSGRHRIYGYMTGAIFNVLWYDDNHGDNDTCVCRSKKKHT